MAVKIYWICGADNEGRIGIMARPRGNEWLSEEMDSLRKQNVEVLVSLLEKEEITELGLLQEETLCGNFNISFLSFPIKDRDIPPKGMAVRNLINTLHNSVKAGHSVVIHCRMGIGRSSIIAAAVMKKLGFKKDILFDHISKLRGLTVPDTRAQVQWVLEQAN